MSRLLKNMMKEALQIKEEDKAPDVLQECLPHQLAFIEDSSRYKVLEGTRRSSKSWALALYIISKALSTNNGKFIYFGLTNDSAKDVMWTGPLNSIFSKYKLDKSIKYSKANNELTFSNGSIIYLRGLDATEKQANRSRGNAY